MSTDTVLAAIDGALEDQGTSGDAMRWQPDPGRVICDGGRPLWPERWNVWRHGALSYRITAIPFPGTPRPLAINGAGYRHRQQARRKRR